MPDEPQWPRNRPCVSGILCLFMYTLLTKYTRVYKCIWVGVIKWISFCHPKKIRDSKPRYTDHFSCRWQLAASRLVIISDLLGPYTVRCHSQFQFHSARFPPLLLWWTLGALKHASPKTLMPQAHFKKYLKVTHFDQPNTWKHLNLCNR